MRRFVNKLKFMLLQWLLDDICRKSDDCKTCRINYDADGILCEGSDVMAQARRVWRY